MKNTFIDLGIGIQPTEELQDSPSADAFAKRVQEYFDEMLEDEVDDEGDALDENAVDVGDDGSGDGLPNDLAGSQDDGLRRSGVSA